jgi:hypothetical protein
MKSTLIILFLALTACNSYKTEYTTCQSELIKSYDLSLKTLKRNNYLLRVAKLDQDIIFALNRANFSLADSLSAERNFFIDTLHRLAPLSEDQK